MASEISALSKFTLHLAKKLMTLIGSDPLNLYPHHDEEILHALARRGVHFRIDGGVCIHETVNSIITRASEAVVCLFLHRDTLRLGPKAGCGTVKNSASESESESVSEAEGGDPPEKPEEFSGSGRLPRPGLRRRDSVLTFLPRDDLGDGCRPLLRWLGDLAVPPFSGERVAGSRRLGGPIG